MSKSGWRGMNADNDALSEWVVALACLLAVLITAAWGAVEYHGEGNTTKGNEDAGELQGLPREG